MFFRNASLNFADVSIFAKSQYFLTKIVPLLKATVLKLHVRVILFLISFFVR